MLSVRSPAGSARPPQFSVMLMDCSRLRWDVRELVRQLDRGAMDYDGLMYRMMSVESWKRDSERVE